MRTLTKLGWLGGTWAGEDICCKPQLPFKHYLRGGNKTYQGWLRCQASCSGSHTVSLGIPGHALGVREELGSNPSEPLRFSPLFPGRWARNEGWLRVNMLHQCSDANATVFPPGQLDILAQWFNSGSFWHTLCRLEPTCLPLKPMPGWGFSGNFLAYIPACNGEGNC